MTSDPLQYFLDPQCTREAAGFRDEPMYDEATREKIYAKFTPPRPNQIAFPEGINIIGDARIIETTMPKQLRPGETFEIVIEWVPRNPPMNLETQEPVSFRIDIPMKIVALNRAVQT